MSDKEAGQKARSPEGCDENGPAAALLLRHLVIQRCPFLSPVRLAPPCRRSILIATPLPQSLTWCTRISGASMTVSLPKGPAGTYRVSWQAVATDTHRTAGSFDFTIQ